MKAPDRAVRLLARIGADEALIGDLIERRAAGRSALWLWRQIVVAVARRVDSVVESDPSLVGVAAVVVAVDLALPVVWMNVFSHFLVVLHVAWNPRSMYWLATSLPRTLFRIVVFLHPWDWSGAAVWCALLGAMAWCLVGIWPKRANLIVGTFVVSNLCQTLPYLEGSFVDWLHDPLNPVWASNFIWYASFTLVAIPASIVVGGRFDKLVVRQSSL